MKKNNYVSKQEIEMVDAVLQSFDRPKCHAEIIEEFRQSFTLLLSFLTDNQFDRYLGAKREAVVRGISLDTISDEIRAREHASDDDPGTDFRENF